MKKKSDIPTLTIDVRSGTNFYGSNKVLLVTYDFYPSVDDLTDVIGYLSEYAKFARFEKERMFWSVVPCPVEDWQRPHCIIYLEYFRR